MSTAATSTAEGLQEGTVVEWDHADSKAKKQRRRLVKRIQKAESIEKVDSLLEIARNDEVYKGPWILHINTAIERAGELGAWSHALSLLEELVSDARVCAT